MPRPADIRPTDIRDQHHVFHQPVLLAHLSPEHQMEDDAYLRVLGCLRVGDVVPLVVFTLDRLVSFRTNDLLRSVFCIETQGRTLEELDEVFSSPSPVQASKRKQKIAIAGSGDVVVLHEPSA